MGKFLHWHVGWMVVALALGCTTGTEAPLVAGGGSSSGGPASSSQSGGTSSSGPASGSSGCGAEAQPCGPQTGGPRWSTLATGLPPAAVSMLMFNPNNSDELWAGSTAERLATLGQGQSTWEERRNSPLGGFQFLSVDPRNADRMVAGNPAGIYLTSDGGETWMPSATGLGGPAVEPRSLVRVPQQPDVLTALTWSGGLFVSMDAGATWVLREMPTGTTVSSVAALAGAEPVLVIARSDGVLVSLDLGVTWTMRAAGASAWTVVAHPSNPAILLTQDGVGGLSISQDRGVTWTHHAFDLEEGHTPYVYLAAFSPARPDRVVAYVWRDGVPTTQALWMTNDLGASWTELPVALTPRNGVAALALHPTNPDRMALSLSGAGIGLTEDGGSTWTYTTAGLVSDTVTTVEQGPGGREVFLAAGRDLYHFTPTVHLRGMAPWGELDAPTGALVKRRGAAPGVMATTTMGMLSVQDDLPNAWTASSGPWASAIAAATDVRSGRIYLVATDNVYRSDDGGDTFQAFPEAALGDWPTSRAYVHPFTHQLHINAQSGTWYASLDGEAPMMPVPFTGVPEGAAVRALVGAQESQRMYAGVYTRGVYRQEEAGGAWVPANAGLPPGRSCSALAVSPSDSRVVYAAINGNGVWKSVDAGEHWAPFNTGIEGDYVTSLQTSISDPRRIFAGTVKRGLAWVLDEEASSVLPDAGVLGTSSSSAWSGNASSAVPDAGMAGASSSSAWRGGSSSAVPDAGEPQGSSSSAWNGNASSDGQDAGEPQGSSSSSWNGSVSSEAADAGGPQVPSSSGWNGSASSEVPDAGSQGSSSGAGWTSSGNGGTSSGPTAPRVVWEPIHNGLPVGDITALAVQAGNLSVMLAATVKNGIFKTEDAGQHWTHLVPTIIGHDFILYVNDLVVHPTNPDIFYVTRTDSGIVATRDGGRSWRQVGLGLPTRISCLAMDPNAPDTLYAGFSGGGPIYKSTDAGDTWTPVFQDTWYWVHSLVVSPADSSTVYAATKGQGLLTSRDGGASWSLHEHPQDMWPREVTPSSTNPDVVFWTSDSGGVTRSGNAGADVTRSGVDGSWSPFKLTALAGAGPYALAAVDFLGRVTVAPDSATGWTLVANTGVEGPVAIVGASSDDLRVAGANGVSLIQYGSAQMSNDGLAPRHLSSVVVDSSLAPNLLVSVPDVGIFRSLDEGASWERLPGVTGAVELAAAPSGASTIYAGRVWANLSQRSLNGGNTWETMSGLPNSSLSHLAVSAAAPARVWATTAAGIYISEDRGVSWRAFRSTPPGGAPEFVLASAINPARLIASGFRGVFATEDEGLHWETLLPGYPANWASQVVAAPDAPNRLLVTNGTCVNVSEDDGHTWLVQAEGALLDANRAWTMGDGQEVLAASMNGHGVYRSLNGGVTWSREETGLGNKNIQAFATLPNAPDRPIVATGGGVFRLKRLP